MQIIISVSNHFKRVSMKNCHLTGRNCLLSRLLVKCNLGYQYAFKEMLGLGNKGGYATVLLFMVELTKNVNSIKWIYLDAVLF